MFIAYRDQMREDAQLTGALLASVFLSAFGLMLGSVSSLEKIIVKLEANFDLRESPSS